MENVRLAALRGYGILDTPPEPEFDAIVREAAQSFDAPIALISLVDENRQWFKAKIGIEAEETPRSISFCTHAVHEGRTLVVSDATEDDRFKNNPLITGSPLIRFYAGAPLRTESGLHIGTLCVIDTHSRPDFPREDQRKLEDMADRVIAVLEARKARSVAGGASRELAQP